MFRKLFGSAEHTASIADTTHELKLVGKKKLLDAALEAGLDWPHDCRVGSCGECRCKLLSGKIKPLTDFSYTLSPEDIQQGTILACQSILKSDVSVAVELGSADINVQQVDARIQSVQQLTHDILEIEVALPERTFAGAVAGQYFEVMFAGLPEPRSYSLARCPDAQGSSLLTFVIRHIPGGAFTDWLFESDRSGANLSVKGPFGQFYLREARQRMICIAGGSGLAPIIALVEAGIAASREEECVVLFGARAQRDLYYLDRLSELGEQWRGRFELVPVLSDEPPDSDWQGARGLVTDYVTQAFEQAGAAFDHAYLCGPPPMVDASIDVLKRLGVSEAAIYFDKFLDASSMPEGRSAIADGAG